MNGLWNALIAIGMFVVSSAFFVTVPAQAADVAKDKEAVVGAGFQKLCQWSDINK